MPTDYDPTTEYYDPQDSAAAMRAAIADLAAVSGQPLATFAGRSFAEIGQLAIDTYVELPDFWRIWQQWHMPQPKADMGDL